MIVITDDVNYKNIANAIREKNGLDVQYTPSEMPDAIISLSTGDNSDVDNIIDGSVLSNYDDYVGADIVTDVTRIKNYAVQLSPINSITALSCTYIGIFSFAVSKIFPPITVNMPLLKEAGNYAFSYRKFACDTTFESLQTIGAGCFEHCAGSRITFKLSLSVGSGSFDGCCIEILDFLTIKGGIKSGYLNVDTSSTKAIIMRNDTMVTLSSTSGLPSTIPDTSDLYIYVPSSLVDTYKSGTNWTLYADRIRAIEDYPDICG